jgi:Chaperone of endosialidase
MVKDVRNSGIKSFSRALALVALCSPALAYSQKADVLLSIDLARNDTIDAVVSRWDSEVPSSVRGDFKQKLSGLRADALLSVRLSNNLESVLSALNTPANQIGAFQTIIAEGAGSSRNGIEKFQISDRTDVSKAAGEPERDSVYTPIVPCRLLDTRGVFSPVYAGGAYAPAEVRTYQTTGVCGVPAGAIGALIQITTILPSAQGDIELLPQGATFGNTVAMVFQASVYSSVSLATRLNATNGQFSTQMRGPGGNVAMDITGYFMAPNRDGNGLRVFQTSGAGSVYPDAPNTVNGSAANNITTPAGAPNPVQGASVVGGGYSGNGCTPPSGGVPTYHCDNRVSGSFAIVGGGFANEASAFAASIFGGQSNLASAQNSAVLAGQFNRATQQNSVIVGGQNGLASGFRSIVVGGDQNISSGDGSVVSGGRGNTAQGTNSWAGGTRAKSLNGSFVWSDNALNAEFASADNEFAARATGGVRFVSGVNLGTGATTAGVQLAAGGGSWITLSDRASKTAFENVNPKEILAKVMALPITTWQYKAQDKNVRHIGPVSQDFKRSFGVGETELGIGTVDADGVALAAIQGLGQQLKERDAKITALENANKGLLRELSMIKKKLGL